jgi:hypothetical protein
VAKLSDDILASRRATASDPKAAAALRFARVINETRGSVSDEDVQRVRAAGYDDGEIAEIVALSVPRRSPPSSGRTRDTDGTQALPRAPRIASSGRG